MNNKEAPSHSAPLLTITDVSSLRIYRASATPDGHDHTDEDGSCHDYSEQILQNYGPRVRTGDVPLSLISQGGGLSLYPHGVGGI